MINGKRIQIEGAMRIARVVPKFALAHSFPCPHCGALNEAP